MDTQTSTESAESVLARAKQEGFDVSATQLARWHRAGLLPKPNTRSLGRGRGTQTVYPAGTINQTIKLCELHKAHRNLREVGWRLWWDGYSVGERWSRGYLEGAAARIDPILETLRDAYAKADDDDAAAELFFDMLAAAQYKRLPTALLRQIRKQVGFKYFESLLHFIVAFACGKLDSFSSSVIGTSSDPDNPELIVERAMGLAQARQQRIAGMGPWLIGSIWYTLTNASSAFAEMPFADILAKTSAVDLTQARDELRTISLGLAITVRGLRNVLGGNTLGLGTLAAIFDQARTDDLAWMLIPWCNIRTKEWAKAYPAVVETFRQIHRVSQGARP